jgi:hypothetical protein
MSPKNNEIEIEKKNARSARQSAEEVIVVEESEEVLSKLVMM